MSALRWGLALLCGASVACQEAETPVATRAVAQRADAAAQRAEEATQRAEEAAQRAEEAAQAQAEAAARAQKLAAGQSLLHAHHAALRARFFAWQNPVPLPEDADEALLALLPTTPTFRGEPDAENFRISAYARQEDLYKVRLRPGYRVEQINVLTLDRGQPLLDALAERLRAQGWLGPDEPPTSPLSHPKLGALQLSLTEHDERPTELTLKRIFRSEGPLRAERALLLRPPGWLAALQGAPTLGYEYGRYQFWQPNSSSTDLERLAFAVQVPDRAAAWAAVVRAAEAEGYRPQVGETQLWVKGARTLTVTSPDPQGESGRLAQIPEGPGGLVIHHQRPEISAPHAPAEETPPAEGAHGAQGAP